MEVLKRPNEEDVVIKRYFNRLGAVQRKNAGTLGIALSSALYIDGENDIALLMQVTLQLSCMMQELLHGAPSCVSEDD